MLNVFKHGPIPASFCLFFALFKHKFKEKTVDISWICTQIVGVEDKHADHLTTTTTARKIKYFNA